MLLDGKVGALFGGTDPKHEGGLDDCLQSGVGAEGLETVEGIIMRDRAMASAHEEMVALSIEAVTRVKR